MSRPARKQVRKATKNSEAKLAKRKLVSGGNPRIAKGEGIGPVRAYIAAAPGWKGEVARQLDTIIMRAAPRAQKAVKWNSPFYGIEGRGWFASFHCFNRYVKLAFFRGADLAPPPPGESSSDSTRYLDIYERDKLDERQIERWIRQASKLQGWGAP